MSSVQALSRYDDLYLEYEVSKDGLKVSESEYWKTYYDDPDFIYEWNNGILEVRPMSDVKGSEAYQWFCDILRAWFRTNPIGRIINLDIGFRLNLIHEVSVRIPDLSVVLENNPVKIEGDDNRYTGTFDLCVESFSYSNLRHVKRDTVTKKREYEGIGVKEYYILDARGHETAFYHLDNTGKYQKIKPVEGDIIKSGILPGFQFRESDLYRQPFIDDLVEDEVYCHYVFPSHKQKIDREKQRADKAEQRIDEVENLLILEKHRREKEKQAAEQQIEKLAAKLRELGISPD